MESREAEDRLQKLAPMIAQVMGWKVEERERDYRHYVRLEGPLKGASIGIGVHHPYLKLEIRGIFPVNSNGEPYSVPYGEKTPSISVSIDKSPAQIVADIQRRLFPEYERMLDVANKRLDEHAAYEKRTESVAQRIAKVVGGKVIKSNRGSGQAVDLYHSSKLPEMSADLNVSDESVTFERFSVNPDEAEEMLKVLIEMRRR